MELEEIKRLLMQYNAIIVQLKNEGVLRSTKVVADFGEYVASRKLGLILAPQNTKGYDAIDNDGKRYEIKTRKANDWNKPGVFPAKVDNLVGTDYLLYVELDNEWNMIDLLKIPARDVTTNKYDRVVLNKELRAKYSILH